jgi:hypothetical protein
MMPAVTEPPVEAVSEDERKLRRAEILGFDPGPVSWECTGCDYRTSAPIDAVAHEEQTGHPVSTDPIAADGHKLERAQMTGFDPGAVHWDCLHCDFESKNPLRALAHHDRTGHAVPRVRA